MSESSDDRYWSPYLDWCAAQVAKHFLTMSSEEVWSLARRAAPSYAAGRPLSYAETVQHISVSIFQQLGLQDFRTWKEIYLSDPERLDRETAAVLAPLEPGMDDSV